MTRHEGHGAEMVLKMEASHWELEMEVSKGLDTAHCVDTRETGCLKPS